MGEVTKEQLAVAAQKEAEAKFNRQMAKALAERIQNIIVRNDAQLALDLEPLALRVQVAENLLTVLLVKAQDDENCGPDQRPERVFSRIRLNMTKLKHFAEVQKGNIQEVGGGVEVPVTDGLVATDDGPGVQEATDRLEKAKADGQAAADALAGVGPKRTAKLEEVPPAAMDGEDHPEASSDAPDMPEAVPNAGSSAADGGPELVEDSKNGEKQLSPAAGDAPAATTPVAPRSPAPETSAGA